MTIRNAESGAPSEGAKKNLSTDEFCQSNSVNHEFVIENLAE